MFYFSRSEWRREQGHDDFERNLRPERRYNSSEQVWGRKRRRDDGCEQEHVHEMQGSVEIAEREEDPHNHRFATVTGEARRIRDNDCDGRYDNDEENDRELNHVHDVFFRTDTFEDHFHEFKGTTGRGIRVGDRHVHFLESVTTVEDGHRHRFRVATLIEDPIGEECPY